VRIEGKKENKKDRGNTLETKERRDSSKVSRQKGRKKEIRGEE
jgi:hypothetical protein